MTGSLSAGIIGPRRRESCSRPLLRNHSGNRDLRTGGESGPPARNARCARRFGARTRGHLAEAALDDSRRRRMAERVGFFDRGLPKPNEINGFAIISRNRNDLASSNSRRRFRLFAGFCGFFYFNGTRNGTRREAAPGVLRMTTAIDARPPSGTYNPAQCP